MKLNILLDHSVHNDPYPRGHEIYNFCGPFLGHYNYILSLSDILMGVNKIFKRNNAFSLYATTNENEFHSSDTTTCIIKAIQNQN